MLRAIRYFDIRLHFNLACPLPSLEVHHGGPLIGAQGLKLLQLLQHFQDFLSQNPRECLLVRIKQDSDVQTPTFSQQFECEVANYRHIFYKGSSITIPLGTIRGKVILLRNFDWGSLQSFGVVYGSWNPEIAIQDTYECRRPDEKFFTARQFLESTIASGPRLFLNHMSAYHGSHPLVTPYQMAWTYDSNGVNKQLERWLMEHFNRYRIGVIIMDYVTSELAQLIYVRNFM